MNEAADIYNKLDIPKGAEQTSLSEKEGQWLFDFLRSKSIELTLEIGFAYGVSTAHIMSATSAPHIAIDPYQTSYHNLGLKNIERLRLTSRLTHIASHSHRALPKLLSENIKIDFALIDGSHKYDEIFIDWFYIDKMLNISGHVVFHDPWTRSTQLVASFVRNNRKNYREISTSKSSFIVFQKVKDDSRPWYHFKEFYTLKSLIRFRLWLWPKLIRRKLRRARG